MTTGALIFAFNNEHTDYVQMAAWNARNIRRHLSIPVALVTNDTDHKLANSEFEQVISAQSGQGGHRYFVDYGGTVTWYNAGRVDSYALSPWDNTLLLDADYVVASNSLSTLVDSDQEFIAHQSAMDATGENDFSGLNYFGKFKMPMWWATVVMFRKSTASKMIFDTMQMVRDNWNHYRYLYQSGTSVYRNDHALSIAIETMTGHTQTHPGIPWQLVSALPEHAVSEIAQDHYRIDYVNSLNQRRWVDLKQQDFHAMGKRHLGDIVAKSFT
jgi:hypothetical protein